MHSAFVIIISCISKCPFTFRTGVYAFETHLIDLNQMLSAQKHASATHCSRHTHTNACKKTKSTFAAVIFIMWWFSRRGQVVLVQDGMLSWAELRWKRGEELSEERCEESKKRSETGIPSMLSKSEIKQIFKAKSNQRLEIIKNFTRIKRQTKLFPVIAGWVIYDTHSQSRPWKWTVGMAKKGAERLCVSWDGQTLGCEMLTP